MDWQEIHDDSILDLIKAKGGNSGDNRSRDRVHVTQLIRGLGEELGIKPFAKSTSNKIDLLALGGDNYSELGFLWEDLLQTVLKGKLGMRPDEIEFENIVGSPDGIGVSPYGPCIEEYKCTWKSSNKAPHEEWRYMMQVQAYCKMLGVNIALFRVFYLNGDYKPPCPCNKTFLYHFTQEEIDTTWFQLTSWGIRAGLL